MAALREYITHTSAELSESDHAQKVVLAGVITMVRPHVSKTGKSMAFAELEDLYGRVELTIFPRTWEEYQDKIQREKVVVVWGKAEVREGGTPKLLVERVSDSLTRAASADARPVFAAEEADSAGAGPAPEVRNATPPRAPQSPHRIREEAVSYDATSYDSMPEPEFPPDVLAPDDVGELDASAVWAPDDGTTIVPAPAKVEPTKAPVVADATPSTSSPTSAAWPAPVAEAIAAPSAPAVPNSGATQPAKPSVATAGGQPSSGSEPKTMQPPVSIINSQQSIEAQLSNDPLLVIIRRCGDSKQDVARLEAVHKTLLEYKGQQRFSICLRQGRKDVTVDFPNDTTNDCPELRSKLTALGADFMP
jgi:DNA polymerase-3 subunit alpha